MSFIYILLFSIFNFFIVLIMRNMTRQLLVFFLLYTLSFIGFHFFVFKENTMEHDVFLNLLFFSFMMLLFYLGSEVFLIVLKKKMKFDNKFVEEGFKFIRNYILPVFITFSQIMFLISKY